ncbi:Ceroid-lipofuscinosis neuronal protein 6 like [Dissostichus eleginoides]|uniref:Ceroid-lipofuscinosis neuronal protein 6 like n=1 Tax=Dissostichus eleginoides TaxID=100907 RepID=A0AAD9BQB9_DISEL|nr:Ceroid-lipofuscinosis neuronal protein 6 like [Dissostichus eleginoides]
MQSFTRKRKNPTLLAATLMGSRASGSEEVLPRPRFQLDLWLGFILHSWILDVGRPFVTLVLPADLFPLNRPSAAEYLHFLFNICTPLILLKMIERTPRSLPPLAVHLGVIAVAMGTSLHLVTDAITRRLVLIGYQLHLSVRENPIMEELRPPALIDAFELLCFFDDTIGHLMWCVPFFLALFLFFSGCFHHRTQEDKMPPAAWMLLLPSAAYYWFLMAEGQTVILFIFTFFAMTATVMHQRRRGLVPDANGLFMLYSSAPAPVLGFLSVEQRRF